MESGVDNESNMAGSHVGRPISAGKVAVFGTAVAVDRRGFLAGASLLAAGPALARGRPSSPATVLARVSTDLLGECPESATFLGLDTGKLARLRASLTDRSIAADEQRASNCNARLAELRAINRSGLRGTELLTVESAIYAHELAAAGYKFGYGDVTTFTVGLPGSSSPYAMSQGTGFFAGVPDFLDSQHKIETARDAEDYLQRLSAFARGLVG